MNLILLVVIVATYGTSVCRAAARKCEMTEAQAESCGAKMMILNDNVTLPETETEIETRCKDIESGIECFKKYANTCLDPMASRVMTMVSRNGKKMSDKICKEQPGRIGLAEVSNDDRIPTVCCSFHMLKECLKSEGQKACDKPESVNYIEGLATGATGDLVKFVCGKFKSVADCDAKMESNSWQKLKDLVASDDPAVIKSMKKYPTPFAALKDMLKKIKN
ncbi:unnamed protein product [Medioppia subpectinata]|uniref:Uncharacterized protein n=1 Tax=Medioppia subpectinata TaxID=1979941 RepID=A0A7R9QEI2_9ACAR|nr:unnamed protein product [Medioppia subpectinata]CAG2118614.1 unnamed protein product [Medioppia subpectinata]